MTMVMTVRNPASDSFPFQPQDSLELELGASATGVHKIPAPTTTAASGAPPLPPPPTAPSNVLDPKAARRLKHKSSSGSKDASGGVD